MKKQILTSLLSAVLGVLGSANLTAQPWQTVDAFQLVPGLSAIAADIGTGADGTTLYSVGSVIHDGSGYLAAVVRKSADSGATWETMDVYFDSNPNWLQSTYRGFGSGADGTLFAAGELWDGIDSKSWLVRESVDGGATWGTADAFYQGSGNCPSCSDIKVSPTGDVFAAGISGSSAPFFWTVRKRAAAGGAFATVDMVASGNVNEAKAIAFHPTAGIFVAGRMNIPNDYRSAWTVRRSVNGGATWTTVDSFRDGNLTASGARGIAVSSSGAIYVVGTAQQYVRNKLVNNWIVRRSLNAGATWTTVDKFGGSPTALTAMAVTLAPSGQVFVTGYSPAPSRLLTRKGTPGPNGAISWVTSDDYQLVPGQGATGQGITSDLAGNIFATGQGQTDSTGLGYWITRRLAAP